MKKEKIVLLFSFSAVIIMLLSILIFLPRKTVKMGFIADLTGRQSQLGISVRNGFLMAVNELNAEGGIKGREIVTLIKNNENDPDICILRTEEMVEEGADVIIGPLTSSMISPVLKASGTTPVISPTVSTDSVTGRDDMFFRVIPTASVQGKTLARTVIDNGEQNILIIIDERNIEYTRAFAEGFSLEFEKETDNKPEIISFTDKSQFQDISQTFYEKSPDALVFVTSGIDGAAIIHQYAKIAPLPALYSSYWGKASKIHEYGGNSIDGMILIGGFENREPTERELEFDRKYRELYEIQSNFPARYSYEAVMLYAAAAEKGKSFDRTSIKTELLNLEKFEGITDSYSLDNFGDVIRSQTLFIIRNNQYEYY